LRLLARPCGSLLTAAEAPPDNPARNPASNCTVTSPVRASLFVALIACLSVGVLCQERVSRELPPPTGSYAIGTRTFDWLDRSRHEQASKHSNEFRQVIVQIWYPAQPSRSPTAPYVPRLRAYQQVWERAAFAAATHAQTHSHLNARAVSGRRAPVVLLSHGWEETRTSYTSLAEDLASVDLRSLASIIPTWVASPSQVAKSQLHGKTNSIRLQRSWITTGATCNSS